MSDYKRITERSGKGIAIKETSTNDNMSIWNAIERLAELEDKIENKTLIELPCKIGDTAYCIYNNGECDYWIEEELVHDFILANDGEIYIITECRMIGKFYKYAVFTTKAEAEAKLRALKGE